MNEPILKRFRIPNRDVSPVLNRKERAALREVAQRRLYGEKVNDDICAVNMNEESGRRRAFVMVTVK